jgi:glycosyltransferase involved in cell wall biosynthesis
VAVVIPCWNAEAWIADAVRSAIAQPRVELDVVVVDDGSDDDSVRVAVEAGGGRVRVLRQERLGVSRARTAGTMAARGEYVQYLDADDVLTPETLIRRIEALEHAEADVAYTDWVRWEQQSDATFAEGDVFARQLGARPDVELVADAWWPPAALLYRRRIVDRIGPWREDLPIIQDARYLLDAALCGARFVYVAGLGARYRVTGAASLSRRDPRAFLDDCYRSAVTLDERWQREQGLDEARRRALIKAYNIVARGYFTIDRPRFREIVARLQTLDPHVLPEGPPALRALSRVIGYAGAEHVARWWRGLKAIPAMTVRSSRASGL